MTVTFICYWVARMYTIKWVFELFDSKAKFFMRIWFCQNINSDLSSHNYISFFLNLFWNSLIYIRSNRGGEYDAPLNEFCAQHGIIHQTTAPYSPQQNGIAERKNRTLKEMMNAMLLSSGLPQNLWGDAILSAYFVLYRIPHKKTNSTPFELL